MQFNPAAQDAIISSESGTIAPSETHTHFEKGRKYLAPGLFGPCGYGFPAIIGAKIGNPDALCRLCRGWRVRHLDERDELDRPQGMARASPW